MLSKLLSLVKARIRFSPLQFVIKNGETNNTDHRVTEQQYTTSFFPVLKQVASVSRLTFDRIPPLCPIHWTWGGRLTSCVAVPTKNDKTV